MIKFMVLGAPRSGTAWAANWLCTTQTHCLHDPLFRYHYDHLDKIESSKAMGVSCTGLALFPHYVKPHPARKVILHRPIEEVNASLARLHLPALTPGWDEALHAIEGIHVSWMDLFDPACAARLHKHLTGLSFDSERHAELADLNVQMNFGSVHVNRTETVRLFNDIQKIKADLA